MLKKPGKTNLMIIPIIYGCMGSAGAFGEQLEKDSIDTLRGAFDAGINCFDTAEMYGNGYSEQLINKALSDKRHDMVIIDKVAENHMHASEIEEACNRCMKFTV